MNGPTEFHGQMLLWLIKSLDETVTEANAEGAVAVLDAAETLRCLRALVTGADKFQVNDKAYQARCRRLKSHLVFFAPEIEWCPQPSGTAPGDGDPCHDQGGDP